MSKTAEQPDMIIMDLIKTVEHLGSINLITKELIAFTRILDVLGTMFYTSVNHLIYF